MPLEQVIPQISRLLSTPAVLIAAGAAALIVIVRDWRAVLFAYGLMSALLSLLLTQLAPLEWALLQAIVGGLIAVMLFLSARQLRGAHVPGAPREVHWPQLASLSSFRFLAVAMVGAGFLVVHDSIPLPEVRPLFRDAILWLTIMGIMGLALHEEPFHAGLALLTILGGFMLLLYRLNHQPVIIGLMLGWQLLLGLAVSYLTLARGLAYEPTPPHRGLP